MVLAVLLVSPALAEPPADPPPLEGSVVRIVNHAQRGNWFAHYKIENQGQTPDLGGVCDGE